MFITDWSCQDGHQCRAIIPFEAVPRGECGELRAAYHRSCPAAVGWGPVSGGSVPRSREGEGAGSPAPRLPTSRYIDPRLPNSPPGNTLSSLWHSESIGHRPAGGGWTIPTLDTGHRDMWTFGGHGRSRSVRHTDTEENNGAWISQGLFLRTEKVTLGQYRKGRLWQYGHCQ